MPKHIPKSLIKCLSKLKKYPSKIQLLILSSNSFSNSKNLIVSSCKQPRDLSFTVDRNKKDDINNNNNNNNVSGATPSDDINNNNNNNNVSGATLSDINQFLYENFRSLYINDEEDDKKKEEDCAGDENPKGISFDSPRLIEPPVNLCGFHAFFEETHDSFTTNSEDMVTSTSTSTSPKNYSPNHDSSTVSIDSNYVKLPGDSIAMLRHSPSPYGDFRRSMQEMVEVRGQQQATVDWDFLEKLFFCYLRLNEKKSYKFILRAFVDLVVGLRQN